MKYTVKFRADSDKLPGIEGEVVINLLKKKERMQLIADMGYELNEAGEVATKGKSFSELDEFLTQKLNEQVESVSLLHTESEMEFNSLEDLEYFQEGSKLYALLTKVLVNGPSLGNR